MDKTLTNIISFADNAHGTQMRKYTPERYIVHPVRVMEVCKAYTGSLPMLAAAILHDVLEDTPLTETEMHAFLKTVMNDHDALETLDLVVALTDVYTKEDYLQYNRKIRKEKELERIIETSADAQTIKYADILDNTSEIVKYDRGFAPRFLKECRIILRYADKGNQELREKAVEMVESELSKLRR